MADFVALQDAYLSACRDYGKALDEGNSRRANRAQKEKERALERLRVSPDQGRAFLTSLLRDENGYVRCAAATHLLRLDEAAAVHALETLRSDGPPFSRVTAQIVLEEWRAGRLRTP